MRLRLARAARRVADHPAHRIARRDRAKRFAGLQGDVGDPARRGIDMIDRPVGEGIDLDGIDEAPVGSRSRRDWRRDAATRVSTERARLKACRAVRRVSRVVRTAAFGSGFGADGDLGHEAGRGPSPAPRRKGASPRSAGDKEDA